MIDGHIHYAESLDAERLLNIIREYQLEGVALLCLPKGGVIPTLEDAFRFREMCEVPVYVFGCIDRNLYCLPEQKLAKQLVEEAKRLMALGCTGIKMLEGKPDVRKNWAVPDFDKEVWEPYWRYVEEQQIPVYFHVNDPEEFWDAAQVSTFAKNAGWYYDTTYVNNEAQYTQVENVLKKHPKLRLLLPHFYFLSKQLDRLGKILESYPHVYIDMTPGSELYYNLSERIEEARRFFHTYQDRICYGTDIGARDIIKEEDKLLSMEESHARIRLVTWFLEAQEEYVLEADGHYLQEREPVVIQPLRLEEEVLRKIYVENFLKFV